MSKKDIEMISQFYYVEAMKNKGNDLSWKIEYYQSTSGEYPVAKFIDSLDAVAKAKIINTFSLLEEFGIRLGLPHTKKLTGTQLWELRILGNDNIRVFYIAVTGKTFVMLHGFMKKTQKTHRKEIKTAQQRYADYMSKKIKRNR